MQNELTSSSAPGSSADGLPQLRLDETDLAPIAVHHVATRHPTGSGPWEGEADKIVWIDPQTGLLCIMRRGRHGALGGFVGIGDDHALAGFSQYDLPEELPISVHCGLDHGFPCEVHEPVELAVCRAWEVPGDSHSELDRRATVSISLLPERIWWFGFSCNHACDVLPGETGSASARVGMGRAYRDQRYVFRETTYLAAQLDTVNKDLPLPRREGRFRSSDGEQCGPERPR